jgi:hypothetical protein
MLARCNSGPVTNTIFYYKGTEYTSLIFYIFIPIVCCCKEGDKEGGSQPVVRQCYVLGNYVGPGCG